MRGDREWQELPAWREAAVLQVRGWPWTPIGVTEHGRVVCLRVAAGDRDAPDLDTLLTPMDRVVAHAAPARGRKVSRHWLRRWVAGWPATAWPDLPVAAAIDAPLDVIPAQLAPAAAVVAGTGTRLLLADGVGQGKTIETGLLLRELAARGAARHVLILTPSTIRDQWREELADRCVLASDVMDRTALRRRDRVFAPGGHGVQAPGIVIASMDLAKQPDVLARLTAVTWDVLVIDEAHGVSGDSARTAAARAIGARSRIVALLTATPHAGDGGAFARLCDVGRIASGPPPVWFRRSPARNGMPPRSRDVRAPRTAAEAACRLALHRYVRRLDGAATASARLAAVVLRKRALSSPAALARSLAHRLAWLEGRPGAAAQPVLPFDREEATDDDVAQPGVLQEPGLEDPREEIVAARDAALAAVRAARAWGKLAVLRRLLRRTRERVLVFTEYRDTLTAIAEGLASEAAVAVLHGGLDRSARAEALRQFAAGEARVLVATDVAAEGLNLQHGCRLVVHVELPWSPARLEQRNGRVDRLGQARRVHVWHLLGEAVHERRVVAALSMRAAQMRADGIDVSPLGLPAAARSPDEAVDLAPAAILQPPSADAADAAARDSLLIRGLLAAVGGPRAGGRRARVRRRLPWRRVRRREGGLPPGVTVVALVPASAAGSRASLVAVHVALCRVPPGSPAGWLPAIARAAAAAAPAPAAALTGALRAREHELLAAALRDQRHLAGRWQASLFERLTARLVGAAREHAAQRIAGHQRRLAALDARRPTPLPVLALLVD